MRWLIVVWLVLALSLTLVTSLVPQSELARLEDNLTYSMGLTGEVRLFSESTETRDGEVFADSVESSCAEGERAEVGALEGEREMILLTPNEEWEALAPRIEGKLPEGYEFAYKDFAFAEEFPLLSCPLTYEELAYVFARIISTQMPDIPVYGHLSEIAFIRSEQQLSAYARVELILTELAAMYKIAGVPEKATFFVSMSFSFENADISVDFEKVTVRCETIELPEALLIFGCDLAYGKRDYKLLLGTAARKVLVNARFYP